MHGIRYGHLEISKVGSKWVGLISHGKIYTFSLKNTKKAIFSNANLVVKIFEFFSSEN